MLPSLTVQSSRPSTSPRSSPKRAKFSTPFACPDQPGTGSDAKYKCDPLPPFQYVSSFGERQRVSSLKPSLVDISDLELETAYQKRCDQYDQRFDTADEFLDYLLSQEQISSQVERLSAFADRHDEATAAWRSADIVREYVQRWSRKRKSPLADISESDIRSHRSRRVSGYVTGRESSSQGIHLSHLPGPTSSNGEVPRIGLESHYGAVTGANEQPRYQLFTLETDQGPIQVPVEVHATLKTADEARKRNTGATGYFGGYYSRRRKEKEREVSQKIANLESKIQSLDEEKEHYRMERDYFRDLAYSISGQQQNPPKMPSPRLQNSRRGLWPEKLSRL